MTCYSSKANCVSEPNFTQYRSEGGKSNDLGWEYGNYLTEMKANIV